MPATRTIKDSQTIRALDASGTGDDPFLMGADNEPEVATFGAFDFSATWTEE